MIDPILYGGECMDDFIDDDYEYPNLQYMTLRDLFAGFALLGLTGVYDSQNSYDLAVNAYKHADAMLAERAKPR